MGQDSGHRMARLPRRLLIAAFQHRINAMTKTRGRLAARNHRTGGRSNKKPRSMPAVIMRPSGPIGEIRLKRRHRSAARRAALLKHHAVYPVPGLPSIIHAAELEILRAAWKRSASLEGGFDRAAGRDLVCSEPARDA